MKRLILFRHAKTEPWFEGADDHGRALTERGHEDARRVAKRIEDLGWSPNTALISSARRARETWAEAAHIFGPCAISIVEALYLASATTIESVISERAAVGDCTLVIGHNPGLHELGLELVRLSNRSERFAAESLAAKFPTGGAALFESANNDPTSMAGFNLVDFIRPKDLRPDA